ncbi:hypothetical protein DL764_010222 [Monosporascus ibericus]|uniref:Ketoreductase (KR) domain-containing protein n=1 Tax=Monosporascus ibericus TaxID=155417 RepID=A0A4Q4SVV2_9PEZI|nr:hypothetical protein DL764_010222 [Monosporascus ibericus]
MISARNFSRRSIESFTETFRVNVTGAYFALLAFLELLDAGNNKALEGGHGAAAKPGGKAPAIQSKMIITASVSGFSRDKIRAQHTRKQGHDQASR